MAKLTIKFVIDLDGDSEANIRPADIETLRAYGVLGLDWVQDMQAELRMVYSELHREVFPGAQDDDGHVA